MVEGILKRVLQAEGLALFAGATLAFYTLGQSWWHYAILFFAPDLAFTAYLAGPRLGAIAYNVMHSTICPILLGAAGWMMGSNAMLLGIAAIWLAHVGFDRMLGYGLKHASGFKDTHLGRL